MTILNFEKQAETMSDETKIISDKTKTGLEILEAAILLGIAGDVLLRSVPLGINVFLWTTVFAAALIALIVRRKVRLNTLENKLLYLPLIIFSAFFAWRDSAVLNLLTAGAILATLVMITLQSQNVAVRIAGVCRYILGGISAVIDAGFAPFFLIFDDIKWKTIPRKGWTKHLFSALRGLAIAVPIIGIFGALFMAADAVFEGVVKKTLNIDPATVFTHGLLISFLCWISAGFLRGVLIKSEILHTFGGQSAASEKSESSSEFSFSTNESTNENESRSIYSSVEKVIHQSEDPALATEKTIPTAENEKNTPFFSLGLMETGVVLGLMNLLFLSFVIIQVRYFFGGAEMIQQITEMTYAEYARRGFFELVWVAALVLPILLVMQYLLRKDNPLNEKFFRLLAGGQIVLLFVIMASALKRMFLYQNEYGLTELRVYTTAFMFWLAVVFLIFCATVLVGNRRRFAFAAYTSALLAIVALHFVNPDRLIVQTNVRKMNEGKYFDANYAAKLSADAISPLLNALPEMTTENQCEVQNNLIDRQNYEANKDWRSWNLARQNGWSQVESQSANWNLSNCPRKDYSHQDF